MKILFIVNPAAAQGQLKKEWSSLSREIRKKIRKFDFVFTKKVGHATELTRQALKKGCPWVVAVGGDGTLCETLNGFMEEDKPLNPKAYLSILPFGRGSDLARYLDIPRDPLRALDHLAGSGIRLLDVGKGTFRGQQGKEQSRYFINIANVGIVPHVVNWSHRSPSILGSKGAYIYGTLRGALEYKAHPVIYTSDDGKRERVLLNMIIANGAYFGSGMKAAPQAQIDDGLFDVVVAPRMSFFQLMRHFPSLYSGHHLQVPHVDFFRSHRVEVVAKNAADSLLVEMDGDTVGSLPATFEILPRILPFKA